MKTIVRMVKALNHGAGLTGFVMVGMCSKKQLVVWESANSEVGLHTELMIWNQSGKKAGMSHTFCTCNTNYCLLFLFDRT